MSIEQQYPTRIWGVKWVPRSNGLLLYSPYTFRMINLNHTAATIWLHSDGRQPAGELIDRILGALALRSGPDFDVARVRGELIAGLNELAEQGLVALLDAPATVDPDELKLIPTEIAGAAEVTLAPETSAGENHSEEAISV